MIYLTVVDMFDSSNSGLSVLFTVMTTVSEVYESVPEDMCEVIVGLHKMRYPFCQPDRFLC